MEQQLEQKWHLVRNNNGEWICSEQVMYLDDFSAMICGLRAKKNGLSLSAQTDYAGEKWYYKHEVEAVIAAMEADQQETKQRKLKIASMEREFSEKEIDSLIMSMFKNNTNGSFDALNEEHPLWRELENNPPQWWKNILADKELYVEIRKDNYINVYYYGGNVALIQWTNGKITVETHQKYLGDNKPVRVAMRKKRENGKEIETPKKIYEYRDCMDKLQTAKGLEEMKRCIRNIYHDIHGENKQGENREERDWNGHLYTSSEKTIQGELKLHFPHKYIDSEFAYQWLYIDKKGKRHKTIRIDLVELKERTLVFTELKLITDSRLTSTKGEPEISCQMEAYSEFIQKYAKELKDYYAKLLRIKKRIGLWDGESKIEHLSLKPVLLIVNTYKGELSKGRETRKNTIEKELKENAMFETVIVDYPDLCK